MRTSNKTTGTRPKLLNFSLNESPMKRGQAKSNQSSPIHLIDAFSNMNIGTKNVTNNKSIFSIQPKSKYPFLKKIEFIEILIF